MHCLFDGLYQGDNNCCNAAATFFIGDQENEKQNEAERDKRRKKKLSDWNAT